jgi:uncharacterized cofD-like protein
MIVDDSPKGCYDQIDMKNERRNGNHSLSPGAVGLLRWLIPGLGVKRWFILIFLGITLIAVGFAVIILEIYRTTPDNAWWLNLLSTASLRFLPRPLRAAIFGGLGLGMIFFGIWELNRSIISPFLQPGHRVVDKLMEHRQRERGPKIVTIGGGHGLATLLRGMKMYSHNITAIVTVADDGGSSGRLRRDLGILPPGDIRNCLAALSSDEALLGQLFQYRFPDDLGGLEGHSFGNLFISALADITGSFEEAVVESGRVLAIYGQVIPSTLHDVRLVADVMLPLAEKEVRVEGESQIPKSNGKVQRVWLEPNNPPAFPQAIQTILSADLIVIGPGSLFTSILPNLMVRDLFEAVRVSKALKVYVCNVATQPGETDHYSCGDHIRALETHVGSGFFDVAVSNNHFEGILPTNVEWVLTENDLQEDYNIYQTDLIDSMHPWRHDAEKLAQVIMDLYQERTGPLVE